MNSEQFQSIAKAIALIEAGSSSLQSLETLADEVGYSPFHFQRLFLEGVGLSPKEFQRYLTLQAAKQKLLGQSVLSASLDLGLSSPSRLHDLFIKVEAITPGEYKLTGHSLAVHWSTFETRLGPAVIGKTSRGICHLTFLDLGEDPLESLSSNWPRSPLLQDESGLKLEVTEIQSRLTGVKESVPLGILMKGSAFRLQVWKAIMAIPSGRTVSYGAVSQFLSIPQASRAVGSAIGANSIAFLIPCHRVLRASGEIGQYRWDHARKAALLAQEWAKERVV